MTGFALVVTAAVAGAVCLTIMLLVLKRCLIVVAPNELVVLAGRRYRGLDGRTVGFRVLFGGRALRIPIIERAFRLAVGPFPAEIQVNDAFTRDNARLRIEGRMQVGISRDPIRVLNAVERFLELPSAHVVQVAVEVIEGRVRLAAAGIASEEAVGDPMAFRELCLVESTEELEKLGLDLSACELVATVSHPPSAGGVEKKSPGQRLLDRLADRDLDADAKQAAVAAMGSAKFTLLVTVERANPPSLGDLPEAYRGGQSAYGLAPNGLEVEIVYPAERMAEVELLDGEDLEVPIQVRAQRWDGPRQCLVVLAV